MKAKPIKTTERKKEQASASGLLNKTLTETEELKKALRIEAALERVRTRAVGMRNPDELLNICESLFIELKSLGFSEIRNSLITDFNDEKGFFTDYDYSDISGGEISRILYHSHPLIEEYLQQIKSADDAFAEIIIKDRQLKDWIEFRRSAGQRDDSQLENIPALYYYFYSIGIAAIGISTFSSIDNDKREILKRFRNVFDFAYRRYRDIALAEAQAREAKIEAALERVRARTMAMRTSDELADTAAVVFKQLIELGIAPSRLYIGLLNSDSDDVEFWITDENGCKVSKQFAMQITRNESIREMYRAWKDGKSTIIVDMQGNELEKYLQYLSEEINVPFREGMNQTRRVQTVAFFSKGFIGIASPDPEPGETVAVLERFASVFNLTYTRFLDLQNAEAQAREAKIEAALERVRTKAMAMHSSKDLAETIGVFYGELSALSVTPRRCGVGLIDKATRVTELSTMNTTDIGGSIEVIGKIKLEGHPVLENIYNNWLIQKEYHPVLRGNEIRQYYQVILPQISFPDYSGDVAHYGYFFYFPEGAVYSWTMKEMAEDELQIYRKFTSVLSLTYRRFIDLKEAEERAFEATRQASLNRVRAEIASMRAAEDLERITPVIWRELMTLDIPFIRCGVFIVDEKGKKVRAFLSTPEGSSLALLNLPMNINEVTENLVQHWKSKKIFRVHWNKEEFVNWTSSMLEKGQIQSTESYQGSANPPESLDLHFVPFCQGMLYVGSTAPLAEEKIKLVHSLADAFSIAYARYEDFRNLEAAKSRIEAALNDLKSAQAQLIHSEKMASLGMLTAGISHEIKNPLNFVNNFSELSHELLDELVNELHNGNKEEALQIIDRLRKNLTKINHHGKRADSIVRGMLLHSRGESGDKTATNINDLLDQDVSLAYHGMRAQDKEFNISIEKDYDQSIEKIKIVPQDISRVFLNILNNAYYAANEKLKLKRGDYSPVLNVSTKNLGDKVEIRIRDNGNGIPAIVKEHIFNPFFTTKPTGEGTGLGLSLSYDIITKVHNGELKFESEPGRYTEFIITLPKT